MPGAMIAPSLTRKLLCLLLLVGISGPGPAQSGAREAMTDAMARMIEAMGLFDVAPEPKDSFAMPGTGGTWDSVLGPPWGEPVPNRSRTRTLRDLMRQLTQGIASPGGSGGDRPSGWMPSRLDGVWEDRAGELLIVQGERFRVYSSGMQRVDGLMRIRGNRLALYNPLDRHVQPFEFAEHQGRLIMRDLAGRLYLYRHLRLGGG